LKPNLEQQTSLILFQKHGILVVWNTFDFKTDLETKSQTTILDSGDQQKRDELTHQKNNLGLLN
jgi:hypothetical protein